MSKVASEFDRPATTLRINDARLVGRTPLEVFAAAPKPFPGIWLDTGIAPLQESGWSYLAVHPAFTIQLSSSKGITSRSPGFKQALRSLLKGQPAKVKDASHEGPPWRGGWFGVLNYELGQLHPQSDPSDNLATLCYFPQILAFSHADRSWWFSTNVPSATTHTVRMAEAKSQFQRLIMQIASAKIEPSPKLDFLKNDKVITSVSRHAFYLRVHSILDFIRAGDIYQLNLSQRLEARWPASAEEFYLALRQHSPAQFGAYIGAPVLGGTEAIASISPELLLRRRGARIETRPIKGTRPRPADPAQAHAFQRELSACEKERAELNMIVDLERNDLGRICAYGSVRVRSPGEIETLPTLYHRVASVEGLLCEGVSPRQILRAVFPGGSVTGVPKRRAMQIIRELEPVPRGPYCGAIGWLDSNGDMELNLAIRTAVCDVARGRVRYHAGSGIVADSDPAKEYDETLQKAAAFLRAVNGTLQD